MIWRLLARTLLAARSAWWRIVYRGYCSRYDIAPGFRFNGAGISLYGDGEIELGDDSYIGENASIQATSGHRVSIGRRCAISHNVRIYTMTSLADADFRHRTAPSITGSVVIGDGVWIGTNVYIGPNITIGANSVVGANAVVTHSVPADEIWGGVPARLIRRKNTATES